MILKSNYEEIDRKYRIDFWIGIGTATWLIAIFSTVLGFYAADFLSKDMIIGLAIVNPIYFMCAMIGVMKTIQLSSSIILGAFLGPIFYFFSPEWSVLLGGLVAGSIAYFIGDAWRAAFGLWGEGDKEKRPFPSLPFPSLLFLSLPPSF